jgi:hypothetical protein
MPEITRKVTPADLSDLLASADRATVGWNNSGEVAAAPAAFRCEDGRYCIGLPTGTLAEGTEVAAVVDEGPMYFDLRGVRVRGQITKLDDDRGGLDWFEVKPAREVAWHYGTLRER